jgi:hypothetical protein
MHRSAGHEATDAGTPTAAIDQLGGFQKAAWGMSEAQIRGLFPSGKFTSRDADGQAVWVLEKTTVAGLGAGLGFYFEDGKGGLSSAIIRFDKVQHTNPTPHQLCDAVKTSLVEKYGDPTADEPTVGGTDTGWRGERTLILLACTRFPIAPRSEVMLTYLSRRVAETTPKVKGDEL